MEPTIPSSKPQWHLFSPRMDNKIKALYRRLFSIEEIENQKIVQIALGALLLSIFIGLSRWYYTHAISVSAYIDNTYTCWPYFQDCGRWYFLQALPQGYSQSIVFMGLFALLALIAYLIYRKEWVYAHMVFVVVWLFKFVVLFLLTQSLSANYDYYDTILLFVILFLPYKLFFARLTFALFYFLASTIKIHEGWVLGTYFTTLSTGLPIFGNLFSPLLTNLVIFMQIFGSWWLLSKNMLLQRIALGYFMIFHLYSGVLVGYRYPTVAFVMLLVLFALDTRETRVATPFTRKALVGWYFIAALFVLQFIPIAIQGDQKMTLEGNYYGLFMFEANHQCISKATVYFADGTTMDSHDESIDSTWRCDPYQYWFTLHNVCLRDSKVTRVQWTFDHSINGGPFYRIVDTENVCGLSYKPFEHNTWIQLPGTNAVQIVGYPRKDFFQ